MERQGIRTERGNINREIRKRNSFILFAEKKVEWATNHLDAVKKNIKATATEIRNEVRDTILKMGEKIGRLNLPIVHGEYLRKVEDRAALQNIDYAVNFVDRNGLTDFAGVQAFIDDNAPAFKVENDVLKIKENRLFWLNDWLKQYADYKPTKKVHDQSAALSGLKKRKFDKEHEHDLTMYGVLRERLLSSLPDDDKVINPKEWREEKAEIEKWLAENGGKISSKCYDLALCEVIQYAQKDLQRIIGNEERANNRQKQQSQEQSKKKNREESL